MTHAESGMAFMRLKRNFPISLEYGQRRKEQQARRGNEEVQNRMNFHILRPGEFVGCLFRLAWEVYQAVLSPF